MLELAPSWSLAKVVTAIQALRGIALIAAITLVGEVGEFHKLRQSVPYLGLTPGERSSGAKSLRGGITKVENARASRVLIESVWTYRLPARIGAQILERNEKLPKPIKDIFWKAQIQLCAMHRRLARVGKSVNVVNVAFARKLAASAPYGRSPPTNMFGSEESASSSKDEGGS